MALNDIKIQGVNLGSWLLMEGYILGGRNIAESEFKERFKKLYQLKGLEDFERAFRNNFITENDFRNISLMGANSLRVPFNHHLLETRPFIYSEAGFAYLDKLFRLAKKYNLQIILDMHAVPGAQNPDWHSDCRGKVLFWEDKLYRERTSRLWEKIADRFKDKSSLLGYDIMNEPVLGKKSEGILKEFYRDTIKRIKAIDKKHIIFLEGHDWGRKIDFLRDLIEENIWVSIHFYEPYQYTFNLVPNYTFPGDVDGRLWNDKMIYRHLESYYKFSLKSKVKIFVGEFGVNWRGGFFGELKWLASALSAFEEFGFGYTYWTYKAIAGKVYPDGLYQYMPDTKYVKREGPVFGWENYLVFWEKEKAKIADFWQTRNFIPNQAIIEMLKSYWV